MKKSIGAAYRFTFENGRSILMVANNLWDAELALELQFHICLANEKYTVKRA